MNLTEQEKKRLLRLALIYDKGDVAVAKMFNELFEVIENIQAQSKGDKGDDYVLTTADKDEIAARIKVPVVDKVIERVIERVEVVKEKPVITEVHHTTNEVREVAVTDSGDKIIEKINDSEKVIDRERIDGLNDEIEELEKKIDSKNTSGPRSFFGARGVQLFVNSQKKGLVSSLNIIPGVGVSLSYSEAFGRNDLTISAAASTSVLTATGTIDDSNMTFAFSSEPSLVVINGASYRTTGGPITWTWDGSHVTISSPVGSGGDIYGIA